MSKLNVGIVGLGTMSQRLVDAVKASPPLRLAAVCHRREERLRSRAAEWGVEKTYLDYGDMLADDRVDAVIVATPNHLHASMTIAALEAGKHVFCEKPPALNAEEAERVRNAARRTGRLVMYGLMFRFSKKHAFVGELRDKGMFGDIYYAKGGILRRCGNPGGWFSDKRMAGGGPLMDVGAHIVDLAVYLMGDPEPVSVFARTFKSTENLANVRAVDGYRALNSEIVRDDVEEMDMVVVNFSNGACLVVETSSQSHIKDNVMYLSLQGSRGGVTVDPKLEIHTVQHDYLMDLTPRVNCGEFDYQGAINAEIQHFADCVLTGGRCIASVDVGYKLMRIISAAYTSAAEHRLVKLEG